MADPLGLHQVLWRKKSRTTDECNGRLRPFGTCEPNLILPERLTGKRPDFPSGIFIGLGLTMWSCIRQRELHIAFADFVRLQRSGRS